MVWVRRARSSRSRTAASCGASRMAAFNDRKKITQEDILIAAELALPHRLKRQPFQDTSTQLEELSERLEQVRQEATEQTQQLVESAEVADSFEEKKTKVKK